MGLTGRRVMRSVKRRARRKTRHAARRVAVTCPTCKKRYTNPLTHTCTVKTDFKKRKRAAARAAKRQKKADRKKAATARRRERRKQAAAGRRERERARKKAAKDAARTRPPRPKGDTHEPGTCGDRDCPRYGCKAYWQGMENCPLTHE